MGEAVTFELPGESMLPPWATGEYKGVVVVGTQLSTRDGRRCGNAVVVGINEYESLFKSWLIHTVITDIGNKLELTHREMEELFHEPKWVMDFTTHNGYKVWQNDVLLGQD